MGETTDKEKAIKLREQTKDLLRRADVLDPPYPCRTCRVGWCSISKRKGSKSCHDTCKKYMDWRKKQCGIVQPLCGIVLPLGDSVPFEQT